MAYSGHNDDEDDYDNLFEIDQGISDNYNDDEDDYANLFEIDQGISGNYNGNGSISTTNSISDLQQAQLPSIDHGGQSQSLNCSHHANFLSPTATGPVQNSDTPLLPQQNSKVLDLGATTRGDPNPIGLKLTMTPLFLHKLNQLIISHGKKKKKQEQELTISQANVVLPSPPKPKASSFPAFSLQIGSWKRISRHEGELVVKCFSNKKPMWVWEALEGNLKTKIQFNWSDISAIRAYYRPNEPGTLEIMLERRPTFWREENPQPKKHTKWSQCKDFTNEQASSVRRHTLEFAPGVLEKHYERIIQANKFLLDLNNKPFPYQANPFFKDRLPVVHPNKPRVNNMPLVPHNRRFPSSSGIPYRQAVPIRALPNNGTSTPSPLQARMDSLGHNNMSNNPSHFVARGNTALHCHYPPHNLQNAAFPLSFDTSPHEDQSQAATSAQVGPSASNNQPFLYPARGNDPVLHGSQQPMGNYSVPQDHAANVHQRVPSTMSNSPPLDADQSSLQEPVNELSKVYYNFHWNQDFSRGEGDK